MIAAELRLFLVNQFNDQFLWKKRLLNDSPLITKKRRLCLSCMFRNNIGFYCLFHQSDSLAMSSEGYVGPPRLLSSEVITSIYDNSIEYKHCHFKLQAEKPGSSETAEYKIDLPCSTLETVLRSFNKIKDQLHLIAETQETS